ncbi:MAG TPA: NUDIX domain-containing protein [Nitrospira sp.]|nr:NUDIX domain-containing protein [Nitrospira sp.]
MARAQSAGLLLYRQRNGEIEVLLVHPGGPFWTRKDAGAWSIPKGEYQPPEDALAAARREFREETGCEVDGPFLALTPLKQRSGKVITAWAAEGELDETKIISNVFTMEWPPKSGRMQEFPEIDRAMWCPLSTARVKMIQGQHPFLDELERAVRSRTR